MVDRIQSQNVSGAAQKLENLKSKIDSNGNGLKGNEIINFKKFAQAEGIDEKDINEYLKNIGLAVDKSDKELHREDIQEFKNEQTGSSSRKTKNTMIDMRQKCIDKALETFKTAKTPEEKAKIMDLVQTLPRIAENTEAFEKQLDAWSKNFDAVLAAATLVKDEAAKKEQKTEDNAEIKEKKPAAETKPEEKVETKPQEKPEEKHEPAKMQKFKVPAGWSVSQIANSFGISRADVLKANVDANGNKAYRVSKKGVEYFLVDQEINIPADAKLKDGVKLEPKTPVKKAAEKTPAKKPADKTPAKEEKWHPPLLTPEQAEAQKKAEEARKKAEAEAARKALQAQDFADKLSGKKPWFEPEEIKVPYMTKAQQRAAEAKRKAEAEQAKKAQQAQDFQDKLDGKKPWIEPEEVKVPYMTKAQQRAAEAKRKAEAEQAKKAQQAQDFQDKLDGKKPWF